MTPPKSHYRVSAGVALVVLATGLAYWPSLRGGFIIDDDMYLTKAPYIQASNGLYRIWCTTEAIDYYPVTNTSLWLEWRLWGMNPTGYRITNLLLHISTALLIWRVLWKLAIPGAFLAALLFAVHPVNVESVAWIAQRKDLLAVALCLVSILCYLQNEQERTTTGKRAKTNPDHDGGGAGRWYWLSLLAFVLAVLSKGTATVLPFTLLCIAWWRQRLKIWDVARLVPFFVLAALLAFVNMWYQSSGFSQVIRSASVAQRLLGAAAAVWFYLAKAFAPLDLSFIYPPWSIQPADLGWWLPLLAAVIVTFLLWRNRGRPWARSALLAWTFFCFALLPVMGFTDVGFMQFTLVADHYQHFALIGALALASAGWTIWRSHVHGVARAAPIVLIVVVSVLLTLLTYKQCWSYGDPVELYQAILKKNPDCGAIHNNLGILLASKGRFPEAIEHYQQAIHLKADNAEAHINLAIVLTSQGRPQEAIDHYQLAVEIKPDSLEARNNLGNALARAGRLEEALPHLEAAVRLKPESAMIHNNLGITLADLGRFPEAIDQYQQAIQLDAAYAAAYFNLAKAWAKLNRAVEAFAAADRGLDLAHSTGRTALIRQIETWLKDYRAKQANPLDESHPSSPIKSSP